VKVKVDTYTRYRDWATQVVENPKISVVIPAYNEQERILPTIGAIAAHMCSRDDPWELIVADDGSQDATVSFLTELRFPNMQVLIAERNGGKGKAVRRGVAAARGDYILVADADQSTPIEQFELMLSALVDRNFAVAVGSRAAVGANVSGKSLLRRLLSNGLRLLVRVLFGIKIRDTQCGFKLFRADAAHDLFSRQRLDGFAFDLELIHLCGRLGYPVAEVPVDWIDAPGSKIDELKVVLRFFQDLMVIRSNDLRGLYSRPSALIPQTANR
jgi:dolichyl-phosphate beta-glucosyltransferase